MFSDLINLFFPKVCAGCDALLLDAEFVICTACRHQIPLTNHHLLKDNEVYRRFYGRLPVEYASALCYFHKKGVVQEMIHKLKYKGNEEVGTALGYWHASDLKHIHSKKIDCVIPVPLHRRKFRERGYNQVTTFAKAIAEVLSADFNDTVLVRTRYSKTQTKKNLLARTSLNKELFDVEYDEAENNRHYLLVDDVMTTGSTLEACGRALLKIPGARISIACMAMSHS